MIDRVKLSTVASYKESNAPGGGGIYSVAMSSSTAGTGGQQQALGGTMSIAGTGQVGGAGGTGQPGAVVQAQTFAISSRNNIVILNFVKWQWKENKVLFSTNSNLHKKVFNLGISNFL